MQVNVLFSEKKQRTYINAGAFIGINTVFQGEWFANSLFDLIHPDDTDKVREQLSTTESQNTGRILDLKSKTDVAKSLNVPL